MTARFDLQSHSQHSDGSLAASEVVAGAASAGIEVLALTDHDTVAGVEEAIAAGHEHGVAVVPAVEISALDDGGGADLHILGYGVDHRDRSFRGELERFVADRGTRSDRMVEALRACGWELDAGPLEIRRATGSPIGRPHLAAAVFEHPLNAERLRAEGLAHPGAVLEAYLLPGTPAFKPRSVPTVDEAIAAIHAAGGLAVWAHPFWDIRSPDEVVSVLDRFAARGIDGVEAFYATFDEGQTRMLAGAAERLGLVTTGSADFHGYEHAHFSAFGAFDTYGIEPDVGRVLARAAG